MAVQLILKNSAVQDKEATAAQLAAGELALNYHSSGPFLQCEDTAGNIWRLGGVVIASTAPSNPSKGAWWLDSDDNSLSFYDGSSWISIQTGETAPGDITEGTARQLLQTNAAGNGTEWTSNIDVPGTLDVTGVATFDNNVVITGNLTVNGTTTTIDTTTLVVEDKNIEMGAVDTPTDSTADGGGITLKGATDKTINWVNATDAWTSSERFSVPLGAQATPSLTFTGDANTGIYSPGADQVAISTNGQGRLFVDSSGRVGVGINSPAGTLHLAATYPLLYLTDTDATGSARSAIGSPDGNLVYFANENNQAGGNHIFYRNGNNEAARIDSSGRVGIGTSSPNQLLHLSSSGNAIALINSGSANTAGVIISRGGTETARVSSSAADTLTLSTGSSATPRLTINSSGNVGVGTTSPSDLLHVMESSASAAASSGASVAQFERAGNVGITISTADTGESTVFFGDTASSTVGRVQYDHSDNSLGFWANSLERARIDSSGRVGIGTSSPASTLDVSGNARIGAGAGGNFENAGTRLLVANTGGDTYIQVQSADTTGTSGIKFGRNSVANRAGIDWSASTDKLTFRTGGTSAAITVDSSQRVGIGTTSPSKALHVDSASFDAALFRRTNASGGAGIYFSNNSDNGAFVTSEGGAGGGFVVYTQGSGVISQRLRIDSSGRLLVGTSSTSANCRAIVQSESSDTSGSGIFLLSRGNNSPASAQALGQLWFTDSGHGQAASIAGSRDGGTWTSGSSQPSKLTFSTTADGASAPTERVRIEATGKTKFSYASYGIERTITAGAFDLNTGNLWTCGAIAIPNPTNAVAGLMGSIRVTAAPTSFGSNFDHPGGSYTAPTSFPAVAPFYCVSSTNILLGSWTEGIA